MTVDQQIFDRDLLNKRRLRAAKAGPNDCDYLLRVVTENISDRLNFIQRNFGLILNFGAHKGDFSQSLKTRFPGSMVISSDMSVMIGTQLPSPCVIADEELFPFQDESFDLIIAPLSLQWVNDLPGALAQIRRGLKPDGVFLAATLGIDSLWELKESLMRAEEEIYGGASPRIAPFADVKDIGHLLQRAGFTLPVTDRDVLKIRYPSVMTLMKELKSMGGSNVLTNRLRRPVSKRFFARVEEIYHEFYGDKDGRIPAHFEILYLMGWSPHPDQQKPLRPGSGQVSLTSVLEKPKDKS